MSVKCINFTIIPWTVLKSLWDYPEKRKYKEHYALNHVSFQVHKGETVGIIGTNGSGKSTILKIITGVLSPTGGEVSVMEGFPLFWSLEQDLTENIPDLRMYISTEV